MYKIAICDDDADYIEYLAKKIENIMDHKEQMLIYKYLSGEEFLRDLENKFDLVFMDMQMDKISGIKAAIKFRESNKEAVLVFCTGVQLPKPEFFDVQPFRYLMKNYEEEKIDKEIENIVYKMIENKKEVFIIVCSDSKVNKISIDDITYISNLKRGCCVHLFSRKDGKSYEIVSNKKLKDIYMELKEQFFEYAHNSYIVNFKSIIGIRNDVITLEDLTSLNISRSKKNVFHSRFAEYIGEKYRRNR